jgi:DNA-binding MarR family transcriptional regulator
MLLTEILRREAENEEPINVMWLQTELKMSFTKVKAVIEKLELRKFIKKTASKSDKRVKYLQVTPSGKSFTYKIISNLNIEPLN